MLKPAYNFYGVAMTQLMMPYVQRLQSVADSVAKLITMFSLTGLMTDMSSIMQGDPDAANQAVTRGKTLAIQRDNQGIVMLDKASEEFFQINTPLNGLDTLMDNTQMIAYPSSIEGIGTNRTGIHLMVRLDHSMTLLALNRKLTQCRN